MGKKAISFRNNVPEEFLRLFEPQGAFSHLVSLAKEPDNTLDLHFRVPQSGPPRATLYLGTSKVVDIHYYDRSEELKIEPQKSKKIFKASNDAFRKEHPSAAAAWGQRQPIAEAIESWKEDNAGRDFVDQTLDAGAKDSRAKKFTDASHEGFIQASLAKRFEEFTVIDRESIISFRNEDEKKRRLKRIREPIANALRSLQEDGDRWTASKRVGDQVASFGPKNPSGFGGKLDALAVDNKGRILTIEVKGGYDTAGMGWTPAQVAVYKRIIEEWIEADPQAAREALAASLAQRRAIGMAGNQTVPVKGALVVVPVIVIGEITKQGSADTANERIEIVRKALKETGEPLAGLEIKQIHHGLPEDVDPKTGLVAIK